MALRSSLFMKGLSFALMYLSLLGTCLLNILLTMRKVHHDQYHLNQNKKASLADQYVILKGNNFYNPSN